MGVAVGIGVGVAVGIGVRVKHYIIGTQVPIKHEKIECFYYWDVMLGHRFLSNTIGTYISNWDIKKSKKCV